MGNEFSQKDYDNWKYSDNQTEKQCIAAVKYRDGALQYVKKQTEAICLAAIKYDRGNIRFVNDEFKTYELCLTAIKCWSKLNDYNYPIKYYREYASSSYNVEAILDYIPDEFKTYDFCLTAVKHCGLALYHVKEEFKTYEMCLEAVKHDGYALRYVKEDTAITQSEYREICRAAIDQNYEHFQFVVVQKYGRDAYERLCITMINDYGGCLIKYIENQTPKMCYQAVRYDEEAYKYVKNPYLGLFLHSRRDDSCFDIDKYDFSSFYNLMPKEHL